MSQTQESPSALATPHGASVARDRDFADLRARARDARRLSAVLASRSLTERARSEVTVQTVTRDQHRWQSWHQAIATTAGHASGSGLRPMLSFCERCESVCFDAHESLQAPSDAWMQPPDAMRARIAAGATRLQVARTLCPRCASEVEAEESVVRRDAASVRSPAESIIDTLDGTLRALGALRRAAAAEPEAPDADVVLDESLRQVVERFAATATADEMRMLDLALRALLRESAPARRETPDPRARTRIRFEPRGPRR